MLVCAHGHLVPAAIIVVVRNENQFVEPMEERIWIDVCYKSKYAGMRSRNLLANFQSYGRIYTYIRVDSDWKITSFSYPLLKFWGYILNEIRNVEMKRRAIIYSIFCFFLNLSHTVRMRICTKLTRNGIDTLLEIEMQAHRASKLRTDFSRSNSMQRHIYVYSYICYVRVHTSTINLEHSYEYNTYLYSYYAIPSILSTRRRGSLIFISQLVIFVYFFYYYFLLVPTRIWNLPKSWYIRFHRHISTFTYRYEYVYTRTFIF